VKLERLLGYRGEPRTVADLHDRGYNFDPGRLRELIAAEGWHQDDRRQALSGEPPGAPVPGGSFERAAALMHDYAFAEGSAVTAIFEQDAPLQGRDLLLVGRFLGFDFRLGVRVFEVVDERGEMRYEVRKRLDSGSVEFRIAAVSGRARVGNPLVRIGFGLLGRREQLRFYDHTCAVMARRTAAEVAVPAG
jgi:hypothetical protein